MSKGASSNEDRAAGLRPQPPAASSLSSIPCAVIGRATLYNADCRDVLPLLGNADLVCTDPPYFKVLGDYWDNEWDEPQHFLDWLASVVDLLKLRLAFNGSLYLFASPQMAARVEVMIRQRMNVLANITWNKGARRKGAAGSGVDVTSLRTFWQAASERVIFAEPYDSDNVAMYDAACQRLLIDVFQVARLCAEASVTRAQIAEIIKADYKNIESAKAQASNWILGKNIPNPTDFERLKSLIPIVGSYDELRAAYEERRQELEPLRRPFNLDAKLQWGDVWDFDPPAPTSGKHPCEKPLALLKHILTVSSKPDSVVLDAFMGSGTMGQAAVQMGRQFVGIERDPHWFAVACKRIEDAQRQGDFFVEQAA